ncbi:MAG: large repetitive protein [Thermoanaerobaculia bacterium]|jgi:hypothetical protein|nr:large repetitive protein [Thermoanaerobaculia bacterium]
MMLVRQRQRNAGVPAHRRVIALRLRVIIAILLALFASATMAADIDRKDLLILGLSLEVDTTTVVADSGIPAAVQTKFGGKINDDAPPDNGMTAVGELTGPGIDTPIRLVTKPGHLFQLPLLYEKGDYVLGNIRLVSADGKTLQTAIPSFANITVTKVLTTKLTVHQLTPDELRARGITVDANNYDVYEYTFIFAFHGETVSVPYPVIIDKRTHEVITPPASDPYHLPPLPVHQSPPRFQPPVVNTFPLERPDGGNGGQPPPDEREPHREHLSIPAGLVVPSGFGVLHQFFAIILNVGNSAPAGSAVTIDSISATLDAPLGLRVARSTPAVSIGQPVPVVDEATGARFLIAAAQGSAEWALEALKTGTHTVKVQVHATYKAPNQPDTPLEGNLSASFVVSDPRFQVNFVHPDTVRSGEDYTAYAFITNTSTTAQTVRIDPGQIPVCSGETTWSGFNVCFPAAMDPVEATIGVGKTLTVPYHLRSRLTGKVFASAGAADENIKVGVSLTMGVSASGIPLSPATLLMPWYTRYLDQDYVAAQMSLFGLGYSLATAPLSDRTALLPRVVPNDVFRRAQDVARAGERIFIRRSDPNVSQPLEDRDPLFDLSLDLLGNVERADNLPFAPDLKEWDALRRSETSGRSASAAMTRQLERVGLSAGKSPTDFANDFAAVTASRSPYLLAIVHGNAVSGAARSYAMSVTGVTSQLKLAVPAEAAAPWTRSLPFAELTQFHAGSEYGELAMVGRFTESLRIDVVPAASDFSVDLIYPAASDGSIMRASFRVANANPSGVSFVIDRGASNIIVNGGSYVPVTGPSSVTPARLAISGAAQDLHLNGAGRTVSLLFNRPVDVADPSTIRDLITLTTDVTAIGYHALRRNNATRTYIPGAALQADGRILNIYFDKSLAKSATYTIGLDDSLLPGAPSGSGSVRPRIDNDAPAGLLYGKVLLADNTPVANAPVTLQTKGIQQFDRALDGSVTGNPADSGRYLFEFIPRDLNTGESGTFRALTSNATGEIKTDGIIRSPGEMQQLNLVFIGRGSVSGFVTYSDGRALAGATVVAGSAGFDNPLVSEMKSAVTGPDGAFTFSDLPVRPFTLSVTDSSGNVAFASNQIHFPGEALRQDLVIHLKPFPGTGTVRITVRRSDISASDPRSLVAGAHVGVFTEGYGLVDGSTDSNGRAEFTKIPAGTISILAADFGITQRSAGVEVDLRPDSVVDQTLTLDVPSPGDLASRATLSGTVFRDDPFNPTSLTPVAGALVTVSGFASVTAGSDGKFTYEGIPLNYAGRKAITAYDPASGRGATFALPSVLVAGTNAFNMTLSSTQPSGTGTIRVRLFDAAGQLVTGYHVLSPGFPIDELKELIETPGIYELGGLTIPRTEDIMAVPYGIDSRYGDQVATGRMHLEFAGQTATLDLRLPGQGNVIAHMGCAPGVTDCNIDVHAPVLITYRVFNPYAQELTPQDRRVDPDANGVLNITKVPVNQPATVATYENPLGFASASVEMQFQGQQKEVFLVLNTTSTISGRVLNWDRQTPIAGAMVHLEGGAADLGNFPTAADGSFRIAGVAASASIRVIAEYSIDGIYRTGFIDTRTPSHGGPVGNLVVILQEQASVEGTIVDAAGAPVPLARYWTRELSWPYQTHGSYEAPLSADRNGHFVVNNVFQGGIHISAQSPQFQEQRGEYQGTIGGEANNLAGVRIVVGAGGTGTISVTVYDGPVRVSNAETTLLQGNTTFDFGQSDGNGVVTFDNVPVGNNYTVRIVSRARARTGSSGTLVVTQGALTSVDVGLTVLGVVSGVLVDTEASPERLIVGGHVTLQSGYLQTRTTTDASGNFRFDGVPEGPFRIQGYDFDSGRSTIPPLDLTLTSTIQELTGIRLTLEPTATLNVQVYLPNDSGGAGAAAPLVDAVVRQSSGYSREQQGSGSGLAFPRMLAKSRFDVSVKELGGEERTVEGSGGFANGATSGTIALTFATSGSVQVTVTSDDPASASLISSAKVTISSAGRSLTLFPDASGNVSATGLSLGTVWATAVSQGLSASASGTLASRSTPLHLTLSLGRRITMAGHVEAEAGVGQPSVNTRVLVQISSTAAAGGINIETHTDSSGNYSITGVPVGNTSVHFDFYGPDGVTRGATGTVSIPNGTVDSYPAPNVKLDATGPRVVSIDPPNNANSVAPNAPVTIVLTEPLAAGSVNSGNFRVIASDDSQSAPVSITTATIADGQYRVRLTPTALLKSNMTYTISVSDSITDPSGNKMTLPVTTNFTTVDYTEPRVVSTTPTTAQPVGDGTTFYLRFNKAIDASVFASGGSGTLKLEQLTTNHGSPSGAPLPISFFIDPTSASTLVVAPNGVALQPATYYRITINGTRDTLSPPNVQAAAQTFDFFSADHVRPIVTIDAPAAATKLIAGVDYTATVAITDEGISPPRNSTDISYVQWFDAAGKPLARVTTAPFGYVIRVANGVTSTTLKASATDLSGNVSDIATQTWEVTPNLPPQNIVITVPASTYVARSVALSATFTEDGLAVTSALTVTGKHGDGTPYVLDAARIHRISAQPLRRNTTSDPWPAVQYSVDVPADVKEADALQFVLTLTDADNQSSQKTATVNVLADTNAPQITSMLPVAGTHYKFGDGSRNKYRAQVIVADAESGVAHVTFVIDGQTKDVKIGDPGASANGTTFFTDVDVTAKNVDTRIHVTATAYDYDGNHTAQTVDVIYDSVNDGTAPVVWWLTPLDGAAVAKGNVSLTLRVRAIDDIHVDAVTFDSPLFTSVTADRLANDLFEKRVTFDAPADGSPFTISATVSDSSHQTVVPITIDQVAVDADLATDSQINNTNLSTYAGKSVRVHGSGKKLYISVPVTLQNLIVADGATVSNPDGTKLDLTVRDHLYVDGDSSIDLTGKGYLGGWASHESGGQNGSANGVTLGNTNVGGASPAGSSFASASYGGFGGNDAGASTNASYGSITAPSDFGSGGSGATSCCSAGGNGGGAAVINGGTGSDLSRFVIAGAIRADGETGTGRAGAGSGGSINLHARALVTGWASRITANGGDDDGAANTSRGGGGGRVAAVISDRFDIEPAQPLMQARGGRNANNTESRVYVDGGAGTLFVRKPGEANGTLFVSSADERYAGSLHLTRATPLATSAGTLVFDALNIGPRALARFDNDYTVGAAAAVVDPTAVLLHPTDQPSVVIATAPAAGMSFIQGSSLSLTYNAQSSAGVGEVLATLTPVATLPFASYDYPASIAAASANIAIPNNAPPGSATLKLRVTDRSGRTAETATTSYTIVANTAPLITQFDVTPVSLQLYAGHPITVAAASSDDLNVTAMTLASSVGTIAPVTPTPNPATHGLTANYTITIPPTTPGGTNAQLTLTATDGSGLVATQTKSVAILHDTIAPTVTASAPSTVQESAGATFNATASIVDAEVGVVSAYASFEGKQYPMTFNSGSQTWTTSPAIPVPNVDGTDPVPKSLVVYARDYEGNIGSSAMLTINIQPLVDAAGPAVNWLCASPGAIYPAGVPFTLRLSAVGSSQANGVQSVQFYVDELAPVDATATGNNTYEITITPAAGVTSMNVRAVATSVSSNSNDALTTIVFDTTPITTTNLTIDTTNTTYDGTKSLLIGSGATVTIIGPRAFRNLAVYSGGTLVQKQTNLAHADAITADRFFVACGGVADVSSQGFARNTANPGAGAPANLSGGGHLGRGGKWDPMFGATSGSAYQPLEAGGGGNASDAAATVSGGGALRVIATSSASIDGIIRANGGGQSAYGGGAGGSIWISTTGRFAGSGSIEARGGESNAGSNDRGAGGGGAIALEYDTRSGTLFDNAAQMSARGGSSATGATGGTGTIFLRGTKSAYGDLAIDAKGVANGTTELPSFGSASVTSIPSAKTALLDALYIPPFFAGHYLQVTAPDNSTRGTWRIASVTNGPSTRAFGGFATIRTQDSVAYDGYLLYSDRGYTLSGTTTQWIAARYNAGAWQYDNDAAFVTFTPDAGDRIFASFSKDAPAITSVTPIACCAAINGVATVQMVSGELLANVNDATGQVPYADPGEFMLRPDANGRGVVLAAEPARVTLEDAAGSPVDVRTGDRVRGAYRFDHLTVTGARVQTNDLLLVTNPIAADASSKVITSNSGAPVIDPAKITFGSGPNGALLIGFAGAVSDVDVPLQVIVHDQTRGAAPPQTFALQNAQNISTGSKGGFSIARMSAGSGTFGDSGASSIDTLVQGYVSFRASQTNGNLNAGFVVNDTTRDRNDPSQNVFHLRGDGQWEVWAAGAITASASGAYATSTSFRIEKSVSAIRWFVDGRNVYELTSGVPASVRFDAAFEANGIEINSIILDRVNAAQSVFTVQAAADGSFSTPVEGTSGDAFAVAARDAHAYPATSAEAAIGSFPSTIGVASVALQPASIAGGAKTTVTITLLQPAGSAGAIVYLSSSNPAVAPVPASITIAANALSASFTITTPSVASSSSITIGASYAGSTQTATLTVVHDANGPSVTITKPLAGTTITEGQPIAVEATIVDAEVGVKQAAAVIDGISVPMTLDPVRANVWTATVTAPDVDPPSDVPKQISVSASDFENNASAPASVTVNIHPIIDALAPTVTWVCGNGSMYPAAANAPLTVKVTPATGDSINTVTLTITGPSGSQTFPMTLASGNYQYTYAVPAAADGTVITLRAVATTFAGKTNGATASLTIIGGTASTFAFASGGTINATDTQYENGTIIVTGGTLTIAGPHRFARLTVINGATVIHPGATAGIISPLDITATTLYVACNSAIEGSSRGYAATATYPGATPPGANNGGSHIGLGAGVGAQTGTSFGSVYRPSEAGAGGESGTAGGGVIRLNSSAIVLDGSINANGGDSGGFGRSGAGGSIWITTGTLSGAGSVGANSGLGNWGIGGGGAVVIEYSSGTAPAWKISAKTRLIDGTRGGGAGSVLVKGPQSLYGDLTIDNGGINDQPTSLPALGSGVAQAGTSGATLVTDRAANIPAYFAGHWVEITTAAGVLKGTWRIGAVTANSKTVTLEANGSDVPAAQPGDRWSGVYRFDSITGPSGVVVLADPIRLGGGGVSTMFSGPATAGQTFDLRAPVSSTLAMTISGGVTVTGIAAPSLHLLAGATLSGGSSALPLTIDVIGAITVDAGGAVDVTGRGYPLNTSYPGATLPANGTGGSHMGIGGVNDPPTSSAFGSVYHPREAGGGGEGNSDGLTGGGVVRITAGSVALAGAIRADGAAPTAQFKRGGAGGSIWISTASMSGAGTLSANGSSAYFGTGGGGAIAIEYTSGTSVPWTMTAKTGASNFAPTHQGGPGSIYLHGPQATYGDLTVDNAGVAGEATSLPSLGIGFAVSGTAGATLVTDRAVNIPAYFVSHWVEIRNASGAVKGIWRIGSIDAVNAKSVTLLPNAAETIGLQTGDSWRGIYRFDHITVTGASVSTADRLDSSNPPQLLNGGTIVGNNQGPPVVVSAKITLTSGTLGPVLTGTAGAVSDTDQPITVFAQNTTSGQSFSVTAAADGSFAIYPRGATGDSISVFARDGNFFPMQSQPVVIGTLPSGNVTPSTIPITSTMTNDGNFRARRLAFDGNKLVAQNYPSGVDTNKVLVFDLSSGGPSWVQTISAPVNTRDVIVRNNVAYIAGGSVYAYDLSVSPATQSQASVSCGDSYSAAIDGAYLFAGSACGDGHIEVYDVTNPKVPVRLRNQGTGISGTYRQLIPYGNYLIGINPDGGSGGSDVVMIDRRDINNLFKVWEGKISSFTGFRAALQGTMLYVNSLEGSVAVVDVSVPTAGVVKSVYSGGTSAHGITAVGSLAFLAADTAGVVGVNAADPANPSGAGGVATSPQAAWDVVIRGQLGIVAAEDRLVTFTAAVTPQVNASKISMSFDGHSVTVQGSSTSILGATPLTCEVRDDTSGVKASGVTVASDGSFSATIAAAAGDAISIVATDAGGLKSAVVSVGPVPFGSSAPFVPITAAMANGDGNFRARHIAIEGTTLAAVNYPIGGTDTNKLLIFDIAGATPVRTQTINVPVNTRDVAVKNGVAYVAGGNLYAYDLSTNPAGQTSAGVSCGDSYSVAVDGPYAFAGSACGDGHIEIYDITNPKVPVRLRNQGTGVSVTYTQLIPYGNGNYLIAITPNGGASGTDVVIIDRRDINNLFKVSATSVPGIIGFRGTISGQKLYLAGEGSNTTMAVVDLSNVAAPTSVVVATNGGSRGVAVTGNLAAFGDGSSGVTFFDVTNPSAPRLIGTQNVGGMSWDVLFAGGKLYAAAEQGIAVINSIAAPPIVDRSRITVVRGASATVSGSAGAISGAATPITAQVKNTTSNGTGSSVTVASDGSFTATIAGASGDALSLIVTDALSATTTIGIGIIPFGSVVQIPTINPAGDSNFRARRIAIDGTTLAAVNYPTGGTDTNRMLIFDISGAAPAVSQTITVPVNTRDVAVKNGVAYVTGGNFYAYDLSKNPATQNSAGVSCGDTYSLAIDGVYAYAGAACGDGRIEVYDITNPKVPVRVRNQGTGVSLNYTQLIPYGNYLIGISDSGGTSASGIDVVVIDRRDNNNLFKVSATAIPGIVGFRGAVSGQKLYMSGQGNNTAMAVVDLSNVAAPTFVVVPTSGGSRGVAVTGNLAAFGDGSSGVTFFDVTNPSAPVLIGTQNVGGMCWDVRFAGGKLYAAAEQTIAVINSVAAPPIVDTSRITIVRGATATVSGIAGAITGAATPITALVKNTTSGVNGSSVTVAADGSFTATIAGTSGDALSLVATDAVSATTTISIGIIPFGSVVQVPTISPAGDNNFRARRIAIEGTTLAAVNYPMGGTDTSKMLIFDISGATPVVSQTISVPVNTRDVAVKNGVAYVTGGNFYAYDLSKNPATQNSAGVSCGDTYSLAIDGVYAYAGAACGDGRIEVYDITNPKVPVRLRNQGTGVSLTYTQIIPYGNYLIGISDSGGTSSTGIDVVIIDRRDINNLFKVSATAIPGIVGFRGTVSGQKLYVAGQGSNNVMAVVDLSNVAAPTFTVVSTSGGSRGVAVTGNLAAFGDGSSGVTFFDVTTPSTPRLIGTQNVGGMCWDVLFARGNLYAAAEQTVAVINNVAAPPSVDTSRITIVRGATAAVSGSAGAITGAATPMTLQVKNTTSSVNGSSVTVAADGSFSTTIAGVPGDLLSLVVTDAVTSTTTINLGIVPFGPLVQVPTIVPAADNNFRARRMAIEGTTLAAVNYPTGGTDTNKLLIFNTSGATPVLSQKINVPVNTRDVAVKNGVAYVTGGNFYAYDLSTNPAGQASAGVSCGDTFSLAIDGTYAYAGAACGDGRIEIYDITNPKVPVRIRNQGTGVSVTYTQLIPYGNYLIGITDNGGSSGPDVVIIDRRDVNNLVKVSATAIPGFVGFRGAVSGSRLYVSGQGSAFAMAVMDLSNVAAPTFAVVSTVGGSHGVAVSGTLAAFGDAISGVTFFDVTNPAAPRLIGTQNVGGMSWDVLFASGKLYAASEQLINVIDLTGAGGFFALAPVIDSFQLRPPDPIVLRADRSRITVDERNGAMIVRGSRGALTGPQPISIEIRNVTLGTSVPVVPVREDGSFEAIINALPADHLLIEVMSGDGEQLEIDLGAPAGGAQ